MNLLLFEAQEVRDGSRIALADRRARHLLDVLRVKPGDSVRVGQLGGARGTARVAAVTGEEVALELCALDDPSNEMPSSALILALPRPQSLKKLLESAAALGVSEIILINSARVEQSYFSSPVLREERIREHLLLGLEQAKSTRLPTVRFFPDFRPSARGQRDAAAEVVIVGAVERSVVRGVAQGGSERNLGSLWKTSGAGENTPGIFAVGPEGGWLDYEIDYWEKLGLVPFRLGSQVLRVENAVTVLLGQVTLLRELGNAE